MIERDILTVTQLNSEVRSLLEANYPNIWIEAEVSNFACPSSGHWYFKLKDHNASVDCAMFRMHNSRLNFTLEDGMLVLVKAKLSLYTARGAYQLIIESVEEMGDGRLLKAFEQLKQKLHKEGLFDESCKKPLPTYPSHIGVITSPTGAAIRDILSVLQRRFPSTPVTIYPTSVQGEKAAAEICHAIKQANSLANCDVLLLSRGGGSLEDLWPFNEEMVAREIFSSSIPIVSGVGHEVDFTIADFVADLRAATPSAAAELITPDQQMLFNLFQHALQHMQSRLVANLSKYTQHIQLLQRRLKHPGQMLHEYSQRLDEHEQRFYRAINTLLSKRQLELNTLVRALDAVSPLATLARGYSITYDDQHRPIHSITDVSLNDSLSVQLTDGLLECKVTKLK